MEHMTTEARSQLCAEKFDGWVLIESDGGHPRTGTLYSSKEALVDATKNAMWFLEDGETLDEDQQDEFERVLAALEEDGSASFEDGTIEWVRVGGSR